MTFNADLKSALQSQLKKVEDHWERNVLEINNHQKKIDYLRKLNKEYLEKMRKLAAQIDSMDKEGK